MEPLLRIYYAVGRRRLYAETLVPSLGESSLMYLRRAKSLIALICHSR